MKQSIKNVLCNPLVWISAFYLVIPSDIIPDALPAVGTVDDLLALMITLLIQDYMARKNNNNY